MPMFWNISYLLTYEDGTDSVFKNVGIYTTDAGEPPRRKHMTFRTRQKFEITNTQNVFVLKQ
jgi:hypothetical protein